jgi:hypothetical protein
MAEPMIHIDMTEALMDLPVRALVRLANISMNQLDLRDIAEVCFHAGVTPSFELVSKEPDHG